MLALALLVLTLDPAPAPPAAEPAADPFNLSKVGAEQALVVLTDNWTATIGTMKRYEKVGEKWMQLGGPIEVVVGESGMGWGLGLHPLGVGEPRKLEGDSRAPAGVFALASAFGRGAPLVKSKMPWLQATSSLVCVDDPSSARYNRIVDEAADVPLDGDAGPPPPHSSGYKTAERMQREDDLYDVGLLVDHNALGDAHRNVIAGRGSCVFVHVWRRKGRPTAGCTAMARLDLEKIVEWLDPARHPVLVALPREEWVKRRLPWGLP